MVASPPLWITKNIDAMRRKIETDSRIIFHKFRATSDVTAVHADASLTQVGERQMSNTAERGGRLCLFVARSALSLGLQALNGTPQSEVTLHESCFCSFVQPAPSNYRTFSRQKKSA
ncbi:hypothetical protein EVAR_42786_1 [Eumeta japonica]|uniref:Uncharacterized protein n=1 Tax=Eumeta variegata TaxID=151549 RepID=A0A4C1WM89_EUMVA|nr:hypothetical protein EVAR_42786_1 [Eumeta japonica]